MGKRKGKAVLRVVLTALLALCAGIRVVRMAGNWESVARFYGFGVFRGAGWPLVSAGMFAAPFLVIGLGAAALWRKGKGGRILGWLGLGLGIPALLLEGLTVFARAVNGNGGSVGAEPLLGLAACMVSGAAVLLARAEKEQGL